MKEQLVELTTAKLAKTKGFDEPCRYYATADDVIHPDPGAFDGRSFNTHKGFRGYKKKRLYPYISVPTQALLQKWLREEHNIIVNVRILYPRSNGVQQFAPQIGYSWFDNRRYHLWEEALEAALVTGLTLIKE